MQNTKDISAKAQAGAEALAGKELIYNTKGPGLGRDLNQQEINLFFTYVRALGRHEEPDNPWPWVVGYLEAMIKDLVQDPERAKEFMARKANEMSSGEVKW